MAVLAALASRFGMGLRLHSHTDKLYISPSYLKQLILIITSADLYVMALRDSMARRVNFCFLDIGIRVNLWMVKALHFIHEQLWRE